MRAVTCMSTYVNMYLCGRGHEIKLTILIVNFVSKKNEVTGRKCYFKFSTFYLNKTFTYQDLKDFLSLMEVTDSRWPVT